MTVEGWACAVHAPKASPAQRLATAMDMAAMRLGRRQERVLVHPATAAELGREAVPAVQVLAQDGLARDEYLFPGGER